MIFFDRTRPVMLDRTLQASGHSVTFLYATQQQEPLCLQLQGGIAHLCLEPWMTGHMDTAARMHRRAVAHIC